ncbi:MAG: DUF433 domain-containing protein [Polyangiaceae bacterium]|nr:DUF433 domain-containing protein [Polyangiaceae bacterium]
MHAFEARPPPLTEGEEGVLRVAGTRVTLDSLVAAFDRGATPEEIVHRYPSVDLTAVYEVIAYMLRNRAVVDEYLTARGRKASELQANVEKQFPPDGIRQRLLARRERDVPG